MKFARALFFLLALIFMTTYLMSIEKHLITALLISIMLAATVVCTDIVFKKFPLKSFTLTLLGLFFGYLMGSALSAIFTRVTQIAQLNVNHELIGAINLSLYMLGIYLGTMTTIRSGDELAISLPFLRLSPKGAQSRDLLINESALCDPRLVDLLNTKLFDDRLIVPCFLLKKMEHDGKHVSDLIKRLDEHGTRFHETDFLDEKELEQKMSRLATLTGADMLVSNSTINLQDDGKRTINIQALAQALKPLAPKGEVLKIKIQRIGKEDDQGVGYLEDGTMVVVNGGGMHLGEIIDSRVLSVKHTSSGRMIFCNIVDLEVCYT